jgi:hypothetical protein
MPDGPVRSVPYWSDQSGRLYAVECNQPEIIISIMNIHKSDIQVIERASKHEAI